MEYVDFSAKTVNDAITKACERFEVPSTKLDYEIVDNGSSGFLGIGAREAKIRARVKEDQAVVVDLVKEDEEVNKESVVVNESSAVSSDKEIVESNDQDSVNPVSEDEAGEYFDEEAGIYDEPVKVSAKRDNRGRRKSFNENSKRTEANFVSIEDKNGIKVFLNDMFKAMGLEVNVELKYAEEERILDVDFSGDSMGMLIGKRGQTLDAIQYLISLVVNRGEESYIHVKADTENYRKRRKDTLENFARNMASKVKRSHRPFTLEPMNPYERRIIHSALQNDKYVTTYSEGIEPRRKVVISPNDNYRSHGGGRGRYRGRNE